MTKKTHVRGSDIQGLGRLAVEATLGLTNLVETMHHNILRRPGPLGEATQESTNGLTGLVYRTIRGVTRLVGGSLDALLVQLAPLLSGVTPSFERDAVLAALNGVLGDHLAASRNPLAIEMSLRHEGKPLDLERAALARTIARPTGRIVLLVHGLCMNDLQWRRNGHDHGAALATERGFTPVYLRYNSGLHISNNGREFAGLLATLKGEWPVEVERIVVVAHSMGGLVARSACRHAAAHAHAPDRDWLKSTSDIFFLGTPHLGAPLERGGNWIDLMLDASPYTTAFARLGKLRSAGITDLRHGSLCDQDWQRRDRFARAPHAPLHVPLPEGARCHAIAASLAKRADDLRERLLGDGLVPLASALGQSRQAGRRLAIPKSRQWVRHGINHLDLLGDRKVYEHIRDAL